MASSRRQSNGRSPIVNQQRQITSFFSKTTSTSPSPTISKQNPNKFSNSVREPISTPNSSPSPSTPSPFQSKFKKPLLVISASPLTPTDKRSDGEDVVGRRVRVYWPLDQAWYEGTVKSFDKVANKHLVRYEDDEEELLDLGKEKVEWIEESGKKFKRLRRASSKLNEAVEIVKEEDVKGAKTSQRRRGVKAVVEEEEEVENVEENGGGGDDDSSDEDWGKNVEEVVEDGEEVMDLEEEDEEDGVKESKGKRGEKGGSRKRKASEGEKLGSAKKSKGGFKFSFVEPTSNAECK